MPDSRDTCGRKPYPEIKIADLKIFEEFWGGGGGELRRVVTVSLSSSSLVALSRKTIRDMGRFRIRWKTMVWRKTRDKKD